MNDVKCISKIGGSRHDINEQEREKYVMSVQQKIPYSGNQRYYIVHYFMLFMITCSFCAMTEHGNMVDGLKQTQTIPYQN